MTIECAFFGSLGKNAEPKTSASGKRYLRLSVRVGDGDCASGCPCWRSTPRQLRWPTGLCRARGSMSRAGLNCLNGRAATAPSGKGSTSCRGIAGYRTSVATDRRKSRARTWRLLRTIASARWTTPATAFCFERRPYVTEIIFVWSIKMVCRDLPAGFDQRDCYSRHAPPF